MDPGGIVAGLRQAGLIEEFCPAFEPLAGGVSCDVWRVKTASGPIVVKRPLGTLRVAADWQAPVERYRSEVNWLRRARSVDPGIAPEVLAVLPAEHAFVVRYLEDCPVWKDELVAGRVELDFAAAVGRCLAGIHAATAGSAADRAEFQDSSMFCALRVDPFIRHVARSRPDIAPALNEIVEDLLSRQVALVHGDVSPKNILAGPHGPVFLDAECAVFGDPAFDLAFCSTHLLLKTVWLRDGRMKGAAHALVAAYREGVTWEDPAGLLQRAGRLTAALLLARVDGKSPVPYLVEPADRAVVRDRATALLGSADPIDRVVDGWEPAQ
jgi:aminoglycoside phosphotransferase (APT) family kinase protein